MSGQVGFEECQSEVGSPIITASDKRGMRNWTTPRAHWTVVDNPAVRLAWDVDVVVVVPLLVRPTRSPLTDQMIAITEVTTTRLSWARWANWHSCQPPSSHQHNQRLTSETRTHNTHTHSHWRTVSWPFQIRPVYLTTMERGRRCTGNCWIGFGSLDLLNGTIDWLLNNNIGPGLSVWE